MRNSPSQYQDDPCPENFNLAAYVLGKCDLDPDKPALELVDQTGACEVLTYHMLRDAVLRHASAFGAHGLNAGDHVLLYLPNSVAFPICFLAAVAVGIIPVPVSYQLTSHELRTLARTLGPKAIIAPKDLSLSVQTITYDALAEEAARHNPAEPHLGDPNRAAYILCTSGTSGTPRPTLHAHRAVWARRMGHRDWLDLRPTDRLMHAGALNWSYTLGVGCLDPWSVGATSIILRPEIAISGVPKLMNERNVSIFAAAPGIYRKMLQDTKAQKFPSLRHAVSAGEKLPQSIYEKWQNDTGCRIYEAYGMTECSTFISANPHRPAPGAALGYAQRGRKIAIVAEKPPHRPCQAGEPGVIAIARDEMGLCLGYNQPDRFPSDKFTRDWFLSGDLGVMQPDGAVVFLGRLDDQLNAGGYRVAPVEIERVFTKYTDISDCRAIEVSPRTDVRVIALFYQSREPIAEDILVAHGQASLARYKQPRIFIHMNAFPTAKNGKTRRQDLVNWYQTNMA